MGGTPRAGNALSRPGQASKLWWIKSTGSPVVVKELRCPSISFSIFTHEFPPGPSSASFRSALLPIFIDLPFGDQSRWLRHENDQYKHWLYFLGGWWDVVGSPPGGAEPRAGAKHSNRSMIISRCTDSDQSDRNLKGICADEPTPFHLEACRANALERFFSTCSFLQHPAAHRWGSPQSSASFAWGTGNRTVDQTDAPEKSLQNGGTKIESTSVSKHKLLQSFWY